MCSKFPMSADMFGLAMVTSLSEIQRNEHVYWQVRKLDGVCILPGFGWQESGSTVSFLQDLGNAIKMMENVPISMTPPRLLSAQSFWMGYVPIPTANWLIRFVMYSVSELDVVDRNVSESVCWLCILMHFSCTGHSRKNAGLLLLFARWFCTTLCSCSRYWKDSSYIFVISWQVYAPIEIVLTDTLMWTQRPLLVKDFLGAIVPMGMRYYLIMTLLLFWLYSVICSFGINVLQYECWTGFLCYLYTGKSGWVSVHLHMLVCFTGSWVFILTYHMITAFSNHSFYFCPRSGSKSLPFNDWIDLCWSSFCIWCNMTKTNWPLRDEL